MSLGGVRVELLPILCLYFLWGRGVEGLVYLGMYTDTDTDTHPKKHTDVGETRGQR